MAMKLNQPAIEENGYILGAQMFSALVRNPPTTEEAAIFSNSPAMVAMIGGVVTAAATQHAEERYLGLDVPPTDDVALTRFFEAETLRFMKAVVAYINDLKPIAHRGPR